MENCSYVSIFKDYLLYDDATHDFLRKSYSLKESYDRLPKILTFYTQYSKVFPNYCILESKKCMFENIKRKQRFLDENEKLKEK